jgi:hypothetical protein
MTVQALCWITKATDTQSGCVKILDSFSAATMVTRTPFNVTLYVHCLCCSVFWIIKLRTRLMRCTFQKSLFQYKNCEHQHQNVLKLINETRSEPPNKHSYMGQSSARIIPSCVTLRGVAQPPISCRHINRLISLDDPHACIPYTVLLHSTLIIAVCYHPSDNKSLSSSHCTAELVLF